jgi:hypothetical protein
MKAASRAGSRGFHLVAKTVARTVRRLGATMVCAMAGQWEHSTAVWREMHQDLWSVDMKAGMKACHLVDWLVEWRACYWGDQTADRMVGSTDDKRAKRQAAKTGLLLVDQSADRWVDHWVSLWVDYWAGLMALSVVDSKDCSQVAKWVYQTVHWWDLNLADLKDLKKARQWADCSGHS